MNIEADAKVCVVTGSSGGSGIGAATVRHFASKGWRVVVNYSRERKRAEDVAEECRRLGAAGLVVEQADVSRDEDCRRLAATVGQKWGHVDVLVNNAGTTRFVDLKDLEGH